MELLIDRLASAWLNWRTARHLRAAQAAGEEWARVDFQQFRGVDAGEMSLMAHAPAIAVLADQAASFLDANNAKNYVQFDMMPRIDHGQRAIRVTVAWANGEMPAEKAARLDKELAEAKERLQAYEARTHAFAQTLRDWGDCEAAQEVIDEILHGKPAPVTEPRTEGFAGDAL